MSSLHKTVLLSESIDALGLRDDSVCIDATANGGGHSAAIAAVLGEEGTLLAIDADPAVAPIIRERLQDGSCTIKVATGNFRNLKEIAEKQGVERADAILADLGWSSNQFEHGARGFSFMRDEPLLMTYGDPKEYAFTAHDIVNRWDEEDIANVLYAYADEHRSRAIAHAIVLARVEKPINTSGALAEIVARTLKRTGKIHPATKTFQALRIAVNDEFKALEEFIFQSLVLLAPKGRLAIISFHSSEDRIVKTMFREASKAEQGIVLLKKPITPTREEEMANPRSRSAKLRVFQKN